MSDRRVFTDQELEQMGTPTLDLVLEAIDAGDKDRAKELAHRMKREYNYLHDGYMFWVSGLLTYIYKNYGIQAVEEAEREAHTIEGRAVFKPSEKTDIRSRVEHMASGLRGHMQPSPSWRMMKRSASPCSRAVPARGSYRRTFIPRRSACPGSSIPILLPGA